MYDFLWNDLRCPIARKPRPPVVVVQPVAATRLKVVEHPAPREFHGHDQGLPEVRAARTSVACASALAKLQAIEADLITSRQSPGLQHCSRDCKRLRELLRGYATTHLDLRLQFARASTWDVAGVQADLNFVEADINFLSTDLTYLESDIRFANDW